MRIDRVGLGMVLAALLGVAGIVLGSAMIDAQQRQQHQVTEGQALARVLAQLPPRQLAAQSGPGAIWTTLLPTSHHGDLGYARWITPQGQTQAQAVQPGLTPPPAQPATEPAQWFAHSTRSVDGGARWQEFQAPVLEQGQLVGLVQVGYQLPQLDAQALLSPHRWALALPLGLMLGVLALLLRREVRPLGQMQNQMLAWGQRLGLKGLPAPTGWRGASAMADHLQQSLAVCEQHFKGLEARGLETLAMHRLLAYKKNRAEAVIQLFPDGVPLLDGEGLPALVNAKIEPLLGVKPTHIQGQPAHEWCPHPDILAFIQSQRVAPNRPTSRPARLEVTLDGEVQRHLELQGLPLTATNDPSQVYGTLITVRDVTQQRLAVSAGAEFVANVSHELKTPLNSLKAYSELLMDQGDDEALRIEAVNVINADVDRMSGLINNLLNISKIETGAISLSTARVNVHDLLHGSFEAQRQSALGQGLSFRIDVPLNLGMAALDKDLLRIALNNLLSNAIKYNRPGGEVVLSAVEVDDATLEIHVRDTGVGMAPEHLGRIFDKHYRIGGDDSRSGHGLGLYLARQIVELHHGSLRVQSEPGQGTEFTLRLRKIPALYLEGAAA